MNYEYYDHVAYYARVSLEPVEHEEIFTLDLHTREPKRVRVDMTLTHVHRYVEGDHRDTLEAVRWLRFLNTTPSGAHYERALVLAAVKTEGDLPRDDEYKIIGYMSTRTPIGGDKR